MGSVRELFLRKKALERDIAGAALATRRRIDEVKESLVSFGLHAIARIEVAYKNTSARIEAYERLFEAASPRRNLAIGYSIVRTAHGRIVKSIADVKRGERMHTQVHDGVVTSLVEKFN